MVGNLLSNAVAYSSHGTPITCAFNRADGLSTLTFVNHA